MDKKRRNTPPQQHQDPATPPGKRISPGKVTRTSKLAPAAGPPVQRRAKATTEATTEATPGAKTNAATQATAPAVGNGSQTPAKGAAAWNHPWMDAAHRGVASPDVVTQMSQVSESAAAHGNVQMSASHSSQAGQAPVQAFGGLSWGSFASGALDLASDAVDFVGAQVSSVIDNVAEWGLEQIDNVHDLLVYVAEVGEEAAEWLMAQIIEHKVEIAIAFLSASPSSALAVFVIRRLPTDTLQSWLTSVDAQTLDKVIKAAITIGAVAAVAAAIFALGQSSFPLIKSLTSASLTALWQFAPEELKQVVLQALVQYWPVGLGLALDGGIGATFGYPVHLGVDAYFEVSHFTEGQFKLRRGGELTEALDTGIGAGFSAGLGGRGGDISEGGLMVGAEVGAQAQAGLKQVVHQEFDFPVMHDGAFVAFILAVAGNDVGSPGAVMGLFSRELSNVQPAAYNTKTKFEFKAFAEGNAAASAGLRTAGENTSAGRSTWGREDGSADTGQTKWWQRWLRAGIFGRIALEAGVGLECENQEWTEDEDGNRVPAKMKVEASGEASAALALVHSIPVISQALPAGINFDGGAGIKVSWELSGGVDDAEPQISSPTYSLFGKTGNMDRYEGAASETSIAVGDVNEETFDSLEAFLQNISGAEVKRRFQVGLGLGRKYFLAAERAGAFSVMLPAEYRRYGFRVEGYLDLESQLSDEQVRGIFSAIAEVITAYQAGGAPLQQLYQDVLAFLSTGQGPAHVTQQLENIANHMLAGVTKLHLHGLVGLSAAAGAKLSAGAKARLSLRFGGQLTMDHDLLQHVDGVITVDDIKELLQNATAGSGALDVEGTGSAGGGEVDAE